MDWINQSSVTSFKYGDFLLTNKEDPAPYEQREEKEHDCVPEVSLTDAAVIFDKEFCARVDLWKMKNG